MVIMIRTKSSKRAGAIALALLVSAILPGASQANDIAPSEISYMEVWREDFQGLDGWSNYNFPYVNYCCAGPVHQTIVNDAEAEDGSAYRWEVATRHDMVGNLYKTIQLPIEADEVFVEARKKVPAYRSSCNSGYSGPHVFSHAITDPTLDLGPDYSQRPYDAGFGREDGSITGEGRGSGQYLTFSGTIDLKRSTDVITVALRDVDTSNICHYWAHWDWVTVSVPVAAGADDRVLAKLDQVRLDVKNVGEDVATLADQTIAGITMLDNQMEDLASDGALHHAMVQAATVESRSRLNAHDHTVATIHAAQLQATDTVEAFLEARAASDPLTVQLAPSSTASATGIGHVAVLVTLRGQPIDADLATSGPGGSATIRPVGPGLYDVMINAAVETPDAAMGGPVVVSATAGGHAGSSVVWLGQEAAEPSIVMPLTPETDIDGLSAPSLPEHPRVPQQVPVGVAPT